MSQNSQVLIFERHNVRVVRNGELWFVLADVCDVLELGNVTETAKRLDDDEKGFSSIETPGGQQRVLIVSEAGVYKIAHTSRKEVAKRFVRWVTHEVLPSIRRTGAYIAPGAIAFQLRDLVEDVIEQAMLPFAERLDRVETKIDKLNDDFGKVIELKRRDPIGSTQRLHGGTIGHFYFGRCPCGECSFFILDERGQFTRRGIDWDYHHQFNRANNKWDATIPLAKQCHMRIEADSEARHRFSTGAFPRWVENVKMQRRRPPEKIQHPDSDAAFFLNLRQGELF